MMCVLIRNALDSNEHCNVHFHEETTNLSTFFVEKVPDVEPWS